MALRVKAENVPVKKVVLSADQGQGSMVVKQAYGNESSLMMATRPPGYHTKPHMHVSEQINHVLEGEIWFFVEDQGYLCKKGDFHRIPANKVHWAWNRSQSDAVVVESHSPPLVGGEIIKGAAGLFDDGETPNLRGPGENQFVPYDQEAVERKVLSARGRNVNNRVKTALLGDSRSLTLREHSVWLAVRCSDASQALAS